MQKPFDIELALLGSLHEAKVRYLCIGRQACILYGLPLQTFDYDLWVHPEEANLHKLIECAATLELFPSVAAESLRAKAKFTLENDALIDIWKVSAFHTASGDVIGFDECYTRRQVIRDRKRRLVVVVPHIDDLIRTKKISPRSKDLEDIKALLAIREEILGHKE